MNKFGPNGRKKKKRGKKKVYQLDRKNTLSGVCCKTLVPPKSTWFLSRLIDSFSSIDLPVMDTYKRNKFSNTKNSYSAIRSTIKHHISKIISQNHHR